MVTSYLNSFSVDKKNFMQLLQFLSFVSYKQHEAKKYYLKDIPYSVLKVDLKDYLNFIGVDEKNHYQKKKTLIFFKSLTKIGSLFQKFDDKIFSLGLCPYVKAIKEGRIPILFP